MTMIANPLPLEQWSESAKSFWCQFDHACGKYLLSRTPQDEKAGWNRFMASDEEVNDDGFLPFEYGWKYHIRLLGHISDGYFGADEGTELIAFKVPDGMWYGLLPAEGRQITITCQFEILHIIH